MQKDQARAMLIETLNEAMGALSDPRFFERLKQADADIALDEFEIDSLGVMDWQLKIEDRTGLDLDPGVIMRYATLNGLADFIVQRTA